MATQQTFPSARAYWSAKFLGASQAAFYGAQRNQHEITFYLHCMSRAGGFQS